MNQQQRKYAVERVMDIKDARIEALREKYTTAGIELTGEDRANLIRDVKVTLRRGWSRLSGYVDIDKAFDFSKYESKCKPAVLDPKFYAEAAAERKRASKVIDQIMLDDAAEALALIEAYNAG